MLKLRSLNEPPLHRERERDRQIFEDERERESGKDGNKDRNEG